MMWSPKINFQQGGRLGGWAVIALLLLGLTWWLTAHQRRPDAEKLRMTVLDVGQGDSIFVQTPSGRTLLIDGGGSNDETNAAQTDIGERVLLPFLRFQGVNRLDIVILTHPHGDHVGGLPAVLREVPVGVVLDGTRLPYPTPAYTAFLTQIRQKRIPYQHAIRGMRLDLGDGAVGEFLNPPAPGLPYGTNPDNATVNNYSAVLRLTYGRTHFLLDGDAQTEAEASMLSSYPDLSCDVLKCGHHGANNATGDGWLERVHPRYAVISCGAKNLFGHPHPDALARLAAHNVQVFRTDKNGAVTFVSDGQTVTARPHLR